MFSIVVPFLVYWLVFFAACYTVCEFGQDLFYGEVTPAVGLKVTGGSAILAALATWCRPSFETMFTHEIAWTSLQALAWFGVFVLVFQFHPWHALAFSLGTMVLVAGLATLGVDSLTKPRRTLAPVRARPENLPIRRSLNPTPPAPASPAK